SPDELAAVAPAAGATGVHEAQADEFPDSSEHDEAFDEGSSKRTDKAGKAEVDPEDVKPFAQGKLHLPVIHRLKLDKPGAALIGAKQSSGFSVTLPGRKVTDSGTS